MMYMHTFVALPEISTLFPIHITWCTSQCFHWMVYFLSTAASIAREYEEDTCDWTLPELSKRVTFSFFCILLVSAHWTIFFCVFRTEYWCQWLVTAKIVKSNSEISVFDQLESPGLWILERVSSRKAVGTTIKTL